MRNVLLAISTALLATVATPALAQSTAQAGAQGSVTIVRPITIQKDADLKFGTIVRPTTGTPAATVSISNTAEGVSTTGTAVFLKGDHSRAKFTIKGEGGSTVSVQMPGSFNLNHASASPLLVTLNSSTVTALSGTAGSEGAADLFVGGSFSVSDATATGAYTGNFQVTVLYN
jgi:hypothetical protein